MPKEISKRDIINFLFILSFPMYGIGTYYSAVGSPSAGYILSVFPHILILLFYSIDLFYKNEFRIRINSYYYLMLIFILSTISSLFIALEKGLPDTNLAQTITKSVLMIIPFHAFLAVILYNEERGSLLKLLMQSLSLLLFINLVGYFGLHISNGTHSIEGRLNFPFLDGFYSGAGLLAIIDLLLLYYMARSWQNPVRLVALLGYFLFNLALFFMINSRLAILIFMIVVAFSFFGLLRLRGVFTISLFTIPILLASGMLLYDFLKMPFMSSMMQRVDIEDVTTFNGRSYLWQDAMDWLTDDQTGILLGNGYKGHYFMGLISDVAKRWNEKDEHHMHLHSTSMEILISQGILFFSVFVGILYKVYRHAVKAHRSGKEEGAFLPVMLFLIFILQVDTFLYLDSLGFVIFAFLAARVSLSEPFQAAQAQKIGERQSINGFGKAPHEWGAAAMNPELI